MTAEEIKNRLVLVLSPKRYSHSIGVMEVSVSLANFYGADIQQAALAGLLHDCAKGYSGEELLAKCKEYSLTPDPISMEQPELLHGPIGARLAAEVYGIADEAVRSAICYHTLGRENMSLLEKIVFIADYMEPERTFPGVEEIRALAYEDLDKAMVLAIDGTLQHIMKLGDLIHPQAVLARNGILHRSGDGKLARIQ